MWDCYKHCIQRVFPSACGWTLVMIVGGLIASSYATGGLTAAAAAAVVGVAVGADALGMLLSCLLGCMVSDIPAG